MTASEVTTAVFAIVGGLTGPLGLLVAFLTYRRDAVRVRVRLRRGFKMRNGPDDDAVRQMLAQYRASNVDPPMSLYVRDPDKDWALITVANIGRRPVHVEKIGWVPNEGHFNVPGGYMGDPEWLPLKLKEGKSRDFPIEEALLNSEGVRAVFVVDSLGRIYFGSFASNAQGWFAWIKATLHLRPFS
ncbi:MAG TPA: hypothetical protein VFB22_01865 [Candidatus Baltobacteraceae bacterium]|nr:hypothetical protein [Candidatus Baltobacteraceae bacterium]